MNDDLLEIAASSGAINGSELGKVWPSADDMQQMHRRGSVTARPSHLKARQRRWADAPGACSPPVALDFTTPGRLWRYSPNAAIRSPGRAIAFSKRWCRGGSLRGHGLLTSGFDVIAYPSHTSSHMSTTDLDL